MGSTESTDGAFFSSSQAASAADAAGASSRSAGEAAGKAAEAQFINILLVDDEPKNLTVLESILDDPAYRLIGAKSADEALLALVQMEFALIVLDIQMPDMNGLELAHMIKQRRRTASIPIIFLTAHFGEDQHVLEGYESGAVDYLMKPVNSVVLRSKVAVFAELHRKNLASAAAQQALLAEVRERRLIQEQMRQLNQELERRVHERTLELLQTNLSLSQSEERLQRAQQAGQVGTWDWDLKNRCEIWSDSARQICELADEPANLELGVLKSRLHPEARENFARRLEEAKTTGVYRDEVRIAKNDCEVKWVEFVGAVEYEESEPVRVRGAVRDITDRKAAELELKEADRRKDQFLAMLGHELRNPLAPIRNAVSILGKDADSNPDLRWCHDVLDRQVLHLTRLVDDLLDVSRVSRGKIHLKKENFDLREAIQQAIEACLQFVQVRRHKLQVTLPQEPVVVYGDLVRLSQVVANLLNNAAKYTDEDGTIRLTLNTCTENPQQAVISLADNGRGIEMQSMDLLFDLFYQVEHNLDRSDGGLGIGLSLARNLVEMHEGRIVAQSAGLGQGSEFQIYLPRAADSPNELTDSRTLNDVARADRLSVLVVDDNRDSARTMSLLLQSLGFSVLVAFDGREAVETAVREHPDIVLLDIGLPRLNGYEACRQMRESGLADQLIIAATGYGQDEDRRRCLEAGFNYHMVKPVNLADLQKILSQHRAVEVH